MTDAETIDQLRLDLEAMTKTAYELEKFKAYVHRRLDEAGVPVDPPSEHREHGCRIGGRLDIVLAANARCAELEKALDDALKATARHLTAEIFLKAERARTERLEKALEQVQSEALRYGPSDGLREVYATAGVALSATPLTREEEPRCTGPFSDARTCPACWPPRSPQEDEG